MIAASLIGASLSGGCTNEATPALAVLRGDDTIDRLAARWFPVEGDT